MSLTQKLCLIALVLNFVMVIIGAIKPNKVFWRLIILYSLAGIAGSIAMSFGGVGVGGDTISNMFTGFLYIGLFTFALIISAVIRTWVSDSWEENG